MGRDTTAEKLEEDETHQEAGGAAGKAGGTQSASAGRGAQRSKAEHETKCQEHAGVGASDRPRAKGETQVSSLPPGSDRGWRMKSLERDGSDHAHPGQSQRRQSVRAHATERMRDSGKRVRHLKRGKSRDNEAHGVQRFHSITMYQQA